MPNNIIEISHLKTRFKEEWIHDDVSFSIRRGEIFAIVGGSGSGKSTLLREILLLQTPTEGSIHVFGQDLSRLSEKELRTLQQRMGVMFQYGGLFTSLSVLDNVAFPLREYTSLDPKLIKELALLKIALVGLPSHAAFKYPAELSGGMQKRASVARALAMDPELLFLDEPTSGLDPHGAHELDELILHLKSSLGLTIVIVTHDLQSLRRTTDRVAFLNKGKVTVSTVNNLAASKDPVISDFFNVERHDEK